MPTCYDVTGSPVPCPVGGAAPQPGGSFTGQLGQTAGCNIGTAPGQCPMANDGTCTDIYGNPGQSCVLIRECDACTGANHVEYNLPSGPVPNANIFSVDGQGNLVYLNANGVPVPPPQGAAPPYLDQGVFTSQFNPTQQTKLTSLGIIGGMEYNPSSGWVPAAGSAPVETQPQGPPAFVAGGGSGVPPVANTTKQPSVTTDHSPTQGGTATKVVTQAAGAPGTSGVKTPVTTAPKNNALLLIAAALAIIFLSRS